ncbi:hypothetical protein V8E54_005972 [Elaphomyces granulatus]
MASEMERTASATDLLSVADLTIASETENDLPDHDENQIRYGIKVYTRGKARPAKLRARSPVGWYWKHGEEIHDTEANKRRWKCGPCWDSKKFTHYAVTSNKSIVKHLANEHNLSVPAIQPTGLIPMITPAASSGDSILSIFDWERLKLFLIEWIVVMHITFSQVETQP